MRFTALLAVLSSCSPRYAEVSVVPTDLDREVCPHFDAPRLGPIPVCTGDDRLAPSEDER